MLTMPANAKQKAQIELKLTALFRREAFQESMQFEDQNEHPAFAVSAAILGADRHRAMDSP